ncbi:MAG: NAD-dependent epimerase/dehydratase family protein, partial [Candidatus Aenigmarchaeota archaeon]|nr:NAD-dependent epimerase/dehydratase family protein [Candidatus Aenigmarchaeota archaeon]
VFHLAAISDLRADEDLIYSTNFIGSKNVFDAAKQAGAKIIFTSSSAVYGETKLAKESDECHPANQYGKSKLRAEKICPGGFIARLFNVYGPEGHGAVNIFCKLIPKYEDVNVFGHGTQTRDFIYVDDVVNALIMGMKMEGVYNIGTGKEMSLLEVIDMIHAMTKAKPNIKFTAPLAGDVQRSRADISKIQQTEWFPRVELNDGIRKVLMTEGFDFSVIESLK